MGKISVPPFLTVLDNISVTLCPVILLHMTCRCDASSISVQKYNLYLLHLPIPELQTQTITECNKKNTFINHLEPLQVLESPLQLFVLPFHLFLLCFLFKRNLVICLKISILEVSFYKGETQILKQ